MSFFINETIALENLDNNELLYENVLESFLIQYEKLNFTALEDKEFFLEVHALKGLCETLGIKNLFDITYEINELKERKNELSLQENLKLVINEIKATKKPKISEENTEKIELTIDLEKELFQKLLDSAKSFRPKLVEESLNIFSKYKLHQKNKKLIDEISLLLKEYNFTQIEKLLKDKYSG
jgi:recombination DNA repair RAD52 pathway protein